MEPETNNRVELLMAKAELERARAAKWTAVGKLLSKFFTLVGVGASVLALIVSLL